MGSTDANAMMEGVGGGTGSNRHSTGSAISNMSGLSAVLNEGDYSGVDFASILAGYLKDVPDDVQPQGEENALDTPAYMYAGFGASAEAPQAFPSYYTPGNDGGQWDAGVSAPRNVAARGTPGKDRAYTAEAQRATGGGLVGAPMAAQPREAPAAVDESHGRNGEGLRDKLRRRLRKRQHTPPETPPAPEQPPTAQPSYGGMVGDGLGVRGERAVPPFGAHTHMFAPSLAGVAEDEAMAADAGFPLQYRYQPQQAMPPAKPAYAPRAIPTLMYSFYGDTNTLARGDGGGNGGTDATWDASGAVGVPLPGVPAPDGAIPMDPMSQGMPFTHNGRLFHSFSLASLPPRLGDVAPGAFNTRNVTLQHMGLTVPSDSLAAMPPAPANGQALAIGHRRTRSLEAARDMVGDDSGAVQAPMATNEEVLQLLREIDAANRSQAQSLQEAPNLAQGMGSGGHLTAANATAVSGRRRSLSAAHAGQAPLLGGRGVPRVDERSPYARHKSPPAGDGDAHKGRRHARGGRKAAHDLNVKHTAVAIAAEGMAGATRELRRLRSVSDSGVPWVMWEAPSQQQGFASNPSLSQHTSPILGFGALPPAPAQVQGRRPSFPGTGSGDFDRRFPSSLSSLLSAQSSDFDSGSPAGHSSNEENAWAGQGARFESHVAAGYPPIERMSIVEKGDGFLAQPHAQPAPQQQLSPQETADYHRYLPPELIDPERGELKLELPPRPPQLARFQAGPGHVPEWKWENESDRYMAGGRRKSASSRGSAPNTQRSPRGSVDNGSHADPPIQHAPASMLVDPQSFGEGGAMGSTVAVDPQRAPEGKRKEEYAPPKRKRGPLSIIGRALIGCGSSRTAP